MTSEHELRPMRPSWTHIALKVRDIDASIAWYERYTHLSLLTRGEDNDGKNAWLGDKAQAKSPFILVLGQFYEGHDPFHPAPHHPLGPLRSHGDRGPDQGRGRRSRGSRQGGGLPSPSGRCRCRNRSATSASSTDPDGNNVEFSFDQGVYEKAREVWGAEVPAA